MGIKEVFDQTKKTGAGVEEAATSLKDDLKTKVISVQKSKLPFFSKFRVKSSEFLKNHKADIKYLLLIIPVVAAFLLVRVIRYTQSLNSRAGIHQASVAFQLQNWTLPPENPFEVWVNSDSPVSFASINISFNPSLVKLTHEISLSGRLTRIIKVTTMAEANSTGVVSIVMGLDPSMVSSPPVGAFQVASLTFNTNTLNPNIATSVNFNTNQMQILGSDQLAFQLTTTSLNLVLNPTPTLSPSPSSTPRLTTTPSPPTPKPTATPTSAPAESGTCSVASGATCSAASQAACTSTSVLHNKGWCLEYGSSCCKWTPN